MKRGVNIFSYGLDGISREILPLQFAKTFFPGKYRSSMQNTGATVRSLLALSLVLFLTPGDAEEKLPTLDEALQSKQDVWGLAAIRQTNGPTYDFFKNLLPPLRYVNAAFHHYPIILSAPGSDSKARLTSNGSGINARANLGTWHEVGTPVSFFAGEKQEPFGQDLKHLSGPTFERGYIPIVHLDYEANGNGYTEEVFGGANGVFAEHGVVFAQFSLKVGRHGQINARIDSKEPLQPGQGVLLNSNHLCVVFFDAKMWSWDSTNRVLTANLAHGQKASLAIATKPLSQTPPGGLTRDAFAHQRSDCLALWQSFIDRGTQIETPEVYVNNAWRSTLIACETMRRGDAMNYSSLNAYDRLYEAECGDGLRGLAMFGVNNVFPLEARLLDYNQDTLRFHNAGFKLQSLAHLYWLTHDTNLITSLRAKWEKEVKLIVDSREKASGLFPKERYCGDIEKPVYALNPNANCWRGLRDLAAVLDDMGETQRATELFSVAAEFRTAILKAIEQSEIKTNQPPFIPMMLFGEEKPYERLTDSMLGSYYNLLAPYVISSGVFGPRAERERWMIDYLHEHGGLAMGMIRFDQHSGLFANTEGVDDLYGIRYTTKLLELDQVDRALVSFYGKLAQGFTRDTFVSAEGTSFRALDAFGRPMYLPPNLSASTLYLWTLRNLLVQDWDLDDDGRPETLRLLFATPRDWLMDGKTISVEKAPTAFGNVSYKVRSNLKHEEVMCEIEMPKILAPKRTLIRARVPAGWKVTSAIVEKKTFAVDGHGTVDISGLNGVVKVKFKVESATKN